MKKSKLIASICTLILSLACLTFGVYSAVKTDFTASGTITFNAYSLDVLVEGTISNAVQSTGDTVNAKYYGATKDDHSNSNYAGKVNEVLPQWNMGAMAFDEFNENNLITIRLLVTNYSIFPIEATATIENQTELEQNLTITNTPISYIYDYDENTDTEPNSGVITITFVPKENASAFTQNLNITIDIFPSQKTTTEETSFTVDDSGVITKYSRYSGSAAEVIIPKTISGENLTSIGKNAFYSEQTLKSITIPNGVTSIGNSAFYSCKYLTTIAIPNSVTSMGHSVFSDCIRLVSIEIPEGVASIGQGTFALCNSLISILIPSSVTNIDYGAALSSCRNLMSIVVASGNTKYDSRNNCNAIIETATNKLVTGCKNTIIPSNIKAIGMYAFEQCEGLTSIAIPEGVSTIGHLSFVNCRNLVSVSIPASVYSVSSESFSRCSNLTSIFVASNNKRYDSRENCNAIIETSTNELIVACKSTLIPSSVEDIDKYAFKTHDDSFFEIKDGVKYLEDVAGKKILYEAENTSITSCTIDENTRLICDAAFWCCSKLTTIVISNEVIQIGQTAFGNCSSLTSITIPSSVTSIDSSTFYGCSSLTSITIPSSVTSIGYYAFNGCSSLDTITCDSKSVGTQSIGLNMYFTPTGGTKTAAPVSTWQTGAGKYTKN